MYYLVYTSHAKKPMPEKDLEQLLFQSQRNNSRKDITGLLLYSDGKFTQVLEGEEQDVLGIFEKIKADDRHHKVNVLIEGDIEKRNFGDWSMGYRSLMPEEIMYKLGYRDPETYFYEHKISDESHVAELFMRLFFDKHMRNLSEHSR
ncbi:MAG: BLUF domain-containing protein [Fulvivirga sp.]|nr:BLUF domain-containing protein [Fulvivirga sp.]